MKAIKICNDSNVAIKYFLDAKKAMNLLRTMSHTGKVYNSYEEIKSEELYVPEDRDYTYYIDNDTTPSILDMFGGAKEPQSKIHVSYINIIE